MKDLLKAFEEKPEIGREVEGMRARGASVEEVASMFCGNGVKAEPEQVEELLAAMQARRAEVIGDFETVDEEQLKSIAGGWCAFFQSMQGSGDSYSDNFKIQGYDEWLDRCFADFHCDWMWYSA